MGDCVCVGCIYYSTDPAGKAKQSNASKPNKHNAHTRCVCVWKGWLNIHTRSGAHTRTRTRWGLTDVLAAVPVVARRTILNLGPRSA